MTTTFFMDFTIADKFGVYAIKDTFRNGLKYAITDVEIYGQFVLALNHKIWQHYEKGNQYLAKVYDALWRKADEDAYKYFTSEEDRRTYFEITD